jgi:CheY-like chemotaxis protein
VSRSSSTAILLIEDDPGDALLVREAFADHDGGIALTVVNDGAAALRLLRQEDEYREHARPDLVLLDLNLPRMSGEEVLAALKSDSALATIPVVVLSTSTRDEDVARSYQLHANAFVTKPAEFERFREIMCKIEDFFARTVVLPPRPPTAG